MTNVKRLSSRSSLSINVLGFLGPFDTPTPNGHYYIIYTLPFNRQWHIWSLNYRPCDYVPYVPLLLLLLLLTNEGHLVFYQFELFKLQFGASSSSSSSSFIFYLLLNRTRCAIATDFYDPSPPPTQGFVLLFQLNWKSKEEEDKNCPCPAYQKGVQSPSRKSANCFDDF